MPRYRVVASISYALEIWADDEIHASELAQEIYEDGELNDWATAQFDIESVTRDID